MSGLIMISIVLAAVIMRNGLQDIEIELMLIHRELQKERERLEKINAAVLALKGEQG